MRALSLRIAVVCAVALAALPAAARAQEHIPGLKLQEQKVKAGLVYNFLKYTTWPAKAQKNAGLRICLYGGDSFDGYLYPLRGRTAQQNVIAISEVSRSEDAAACDFVFIHAKQEKHLQHLLRALEGHHVMTASDIRDFAGKGGMIEFATDKQRIAVFINEDAISAAGLRIDSRLLKFARPFPGGRE